MRSDDVAAWWSRAENLALDILEDLRFWAGALCRAIDVTDVTDILEDLRFWAHGTPIVLSLVTHVTPRFVPLHSRLDGLTLHPVSCRYAVGWTD